MKHLECRDMGTYLRELENNPDARAECDRLMTVSISRFFRDRGFWLTLQNEILPDLIQRNHETLNIWSAGCACGEEVYSFKMVWDQLKNRYAKLPKIHITASDMNPVYLERAKAGIYSSSSLKEVPEKLRPTYFDVEADGNRYALKPFMKRDISWKLHHLHSDPPGSDYHLIFLRNNLLTYYHDRLKMAGIRNVLDRLRPAGFLIVGSHEHLPPGTPDLISYLNFSYLFRKQDTEQNRDKLVDIYSEVVLRI